MKKLSALLLVFVMILSFSVSVYGETQGMIFSAETMYRTRGALTGYPVTFEATVKFPQGYTDRGGVILGNYTTSSTPCVSFGTYDNGQPRIYYCDDSKTVGDFRFKSINICTGEPVHMAIVMDIDASKAYCYIDGELKETLTGVAYPSSINYSSIALGGDLRDGNAQYFKGEIYDVRIYSDMRSAEEISNDALGTSLDESELIAAYDTLGYSADNLPEKIEDKSGNGNDLILKQTWMKEAPKLKPYAYSFAVVGDTQIVNRDYPQHFSGIYDWILDNVDHYNTKFIFGLGDITDKSYEREYALADAVFKRLKGVIPFSFIRGNHDKSEGFNRYFTVEEYGDQVSGYYDGKMENTYHKFDVGKVKYLVVNIDCGASDNMLAWANEVCAANPDRNIIVTTHGYLMPDGSVIGDDLWEDKWGPNSGGDIWDKFIRKHKNIVLVMCGHEPNDTLVVTRQTGDNGNVVTQLLVDPQYVDKAYEGGVGLVAMLHFSEDGKNVQVSYYSTIKKQYFMAENQFEFTIETVTSDEEVPSAKIMDSSLSVPLPKVAENNVSLTLDADRYIFNANTEEKCSLTLDVDTQNRTSGKVIAALYDRFNRLKSVNIYDCKPCVNVSFDDVYSGDRVRVHWWNGASTLMPIGNER